MQTIRIARTVLNANNGTASIDAERGKGITMTVTQGDQTITLCFGTLIAKVLADRIKSAVSEWRAVCGMTP